MAEDSPADVRVKAAAIIENIDCEPPMSEADRFSLVEALAADLTTGADQATVDEKRLLKIEARTYALAEAIITMADTAPAA